MRIRPSKMRVIAGRFKGHILKMPKGVKIRPSSQKVKEALFGILDKEICGASFLELFAGSGNTGIEALSRGAKVVVFVENNRLCIRSIGENLRRIGIRYSYGLKGLDAGKEVCAILLPLDAERVIKVFCQRKQKFDFVFLDPPYYQDVELKNCLIKICHYDILFPRSLVIAEHNKSLFFPHLLVGLRLMFTKGYGDTALSFYQKGDKKCRKK